MAVWSLATAAAAQVGPATPAPACVAAPLGDLPPLCRTPTGYTGFAAGGAVQGSLDATIDRLAPAIADYQQAVERYDALSRLQGVPADVRTSAEQGRAASVEAYEAELAKLVAEFRANPGWRAEIFYSNVTDLLIRQTTGIAAAADLFEQARQRSEAADAAAREAAREAAEQAEIKRREAAELEARIAAAARKKLTIGLLTIVGALAVAGGLFLYRGRLSKPELGAELAGYGAPLNDAQARIYRAVRKSAERTEFTHTLIIACISGFIALWFATLHNVPWAPGYLAFLTFIYVGIVAFALFMIVSIRLVGREARIRRGIHKAHAEWQCPECHSHFAMAQEKLGERFLAAIPRQDRTVRVSSGEQRVTERSWTEARYEVDLKDYCVCCSYSNEYAVTETRKENMTATTYTR